ncbi:SRPBCC family protein [Saccharopolyspora erythraea]|uniref:SRPBCC family protein n=1 Tax=Saccharopolyspora erythraea TaxID=1836 RepID=UPI001BA84CFC|nr:SRPBCC family protein [Saccharopolyspora erythraea]QUG99714.1 SRPBCC family protein [Saccharopolyspora erythraea]
MDPAPFRTDVSLHRNGTGHPTLRFERRYRHSKEQVWRALTEEAELAAWFPCAARIEATPGGTATFTFPGAPPQTGEVLVAEPPRALVFTWHGETLRWRLADVPGGCLLRLDIENQDPAHAAQSAAGYDLCLGQLATLLAAGSVRRVEMPPPQEVVQHYAEAFSAPDA